MGKLNFSGNESFHCRSPWLKKRHDFLSKGKNFREPSSVVDLGVGKSMISSIKYWMRSFGLIQTDSKLSDISNFLFGQKGIDTYLENTATLWLLHYHLIKENRVSIYLI